MERRAGILLHPTSLPGPHGIGEIGPHARRFLEWLERAGQTIWQVLPLHPVDGSGSPYSSPSAMARNTLLISLDDLVADAWLLPGEVPTIGGDPTRVSYPAAIAARTPLLARAADRAAQTVDLEHFANAHAWVRPWALFAALVHHHGPRWTAWPEPLRERDPAALARATDAYAAEIARETALQWLFTDQWKRLRLDAKQRGIALWGDIPFFVSGEGCETWTSRELFRLDAAGHPTVVSGVPPDLFAAKGQLWGHPLYDEKTQRYTRYRFWVDRVEAVIDLVDLARIDHFRGLAAYWEVPAGAADATGGRWIPGPGQPLIDTLRKRFGGLPFVAEDLGIITPDVEELRDQNGLPGMLILQFAFGNPDPETPYLLHNHRPGAVVYPGTHDNDTCLGWYRAARPVVQDHVRRYFSSHGEDIAGDFVRFAYRSVAATAIVSMQDVIGLGSEARMNVPGRRDGNWAWRLGPGGPDSVLADRLAEQVRLTGRQAPR